MILFLLWPRKLFKRSSLEAYGWHYEYFTESSLKIRPIAYIQEAKFYCQLYLGSHNDFSFGYVLQVFVWIFFFFFLFFFFSPVLTFPCCCYKEDSYYQCRMSIIWGIWTMSLLPHKYREYDVQRNEGRCTENRAYCNSVYPEVPKVMQNAKITLTMFSYAEKSLEKPTDLWDVTKRNVCLEFGRVKNEDKI